MRIQSISMKDSKLEVDKAASSHNIEGGPYVFEYTEKMTIKSKDDSESPNKLKKYEENLIKDAESQIGAQSAKDAEVSHSLS